MAAAAIPSLNAAAAVWAGDRRTPYYPKRPALGWRCRQENTKRRRYQLGAAANQNRHAIERVYSVFTSDRGRRVLSTFLREVDGPTGRREAPAAKLCNDGVNLRRALRHCAACPSSCRSMEPLGNAMERALRCRQPQAKNSNNNNALLLACRSRGPSVSVAAALRAWGENDEPLSSDALHPRWTVTRP